MVPVRTRGGFVALESSFQAGVKREVLRSLCQLANDTQLRLEVALAGGLKSSGSFSRGFSRQESLVRISAGSLWRLCPGHVETVCSVLACPCPCSGS